MSRQKKINLKARYFSPKMKMKLSYIKDYPLTIACAPSGFGKSTAINHFLAEVSETTQILRHTFLSSQPSVSWNDLCKLLFQIDAVAATELMQIGVPCNENAAEISEVFEKLRCPVETFLLLDSFERSALPELVLPIFARRENAKLHIIVVTRELALSALLSNLQIYRLAPEDFLFSEADIAGYFEKAGFEISSMEARQLRRITSGWAWALYLQLKAFAQSGEFSSAEISQLVRRVVWDELSEGIRNFFLSVSILSRFTISEAVEMSGLSPNAVERILDAHSAYVIFDTATYSFYFHTIFESFLSQQFFALPKEEQQRIYFLGGDVSRRAGERQNALKFYYLSGNWERLFETPLTSYELADVVDDVTKPMIIDIVNRTSHELKVKYTASLVPFAFALFFMNENARLVEAYKEIAGLLAENDMPQREKDAIQGEMDLLMSFLKYNRIDEMSAMHRRALKQIGGAASLVSVKSTWTFGSPSILYMYWREQGMLETELKQMDECMPIYYKLTKHHGAGAEHIMRAEAYYMRGMDEEAEATCYQGMFAANTWGQSSIYQCGLFLLARIAVLRGDTELFQNSLIGISERAHSSKEDLCRYTGDISMGFLSILTKNYSAVPPWLAAGEITEARLVVLTQPIAHVIYCAYLLHLREYRKLLGICQHVIAISGNLPNLLPQVYAHIFTACAREGLGQYDMAVDALTIALYMVIEDEIYMPFAECYDKLEKLLDRVVMPKARMAVSKIRELSRRMRDSSVKMSQKVPEFSAQEQKIYDWAKRGLDNKAIAERLGIQTSTVRNQFSRMYVKAGVTNKTQLLLLDL